MTWTRQHDLAIAQRLMGYRCHVSPAGRWYIHDGETNRPLPDYQTDGAELLLALEGWLWGGKRAARVQSLEWVDGYPTLITELKQQGEQIEWTASLRGPSGQIIRNLAWALYRAVTE